MTRPRPSLSRMNLWKFPRARTSSRKAVPNVISVARPMWATTSRTRQPSHSEGRSHSSGRISVRASAMASRCSLIYRHISSRSNRTPSSDRTSESLSPPEDMAPPSRDVHGLAQRINGRLRQSTRCLAGNACPHGPPSQPATTAVRVNTQPPERGAGAEAPAMPKHSGGRAPERSAQSKDACEAAGPVSVRPGCAPTWRRWRPASSRASRLGSPAASLSMFHGKHRAALGVAREVWDGRLRSRGVIALQAVPTSPFQVKPSHARIGSDGAYLWAYQCPSIARPAQARLRTHLGCAIADSAADRRAPPATPNSPSATKPPSTSSSPHLAASLANS